MEESENLYKLYGYGLCKGTREPPKETFKVQETLHFRYLKLLVVSGRAPFKGTNDVCHAAGTFWVDDFPAFPRLVGYVIVRFPEGAAGFLSRLPLRN